MWTVFLAKLDVKKCDSSDPANNDQNFPNLIKDLHDKLLSIQNQEKFTNGELKTQFKVEKGVLRIYGDDTTLTLTSDGTLEVSHPAA